MKKFFISALAIMFVFGVSLYAAPNTGLTKQVKQGNTQRRTTATNTRANTRTNTRANTRANTNATRANATRANANATKTKANAKAKAKTASQSTAKTKAQLRKEAQQRTFGLMPSELDDMAHNVFHAKAAAVKGARDTESALRYLPFITIINTAGFGQSFDMRGQGRLSANGVKLYINGIAANPVDSYSQPMPIATIIPQLIREVNVYPGSGAVLYGSGTRGGTINIVTSKRDAPYFVVGGGYLNNTATQGNSFNAFAHATERVNPFLQLNAGLAFNQIGGPREDDLQQQGQAVLGAEYNIGWGQSLSFDVDAFMAKIKTTPYNSLIDEKAVDKIMREHSNGDFGGDGVDWRDEINRYACLANAYTNQPHGSKTLTEACAVKAFNFKPSKKDRKKKGNGRIENKNTRITGDIIYKNEITKELNLELKGLYHLSQLKYDKHKMNLPYFVLAYLDDTQTPSEGFPYQGYNWFLPRPTNQSNTGTPNLYLWNEGYGADGERTDYHYLDQSGSTFSENKFGIRASMDFKHGNGSLLVFGLSSNYEMSNKKQNTHLRQAIADAATFHLKQGEKKNQVMLKPSSRI